MAFVLFYELINLFLKNFRSDGIQLLREFDYDIFGIDRGFLYY